MGQMFRDRNSFIEKYNDILLYRPLSPGYTMLVF